MVSGYINNYLLIYNNLPTLKNLNFNKFLHYCNREKCIMVSESPSIILYLRPQRLYNIIILS